jgi:hypothetical protein
MESYYSYSVVNEAIIYEIEHDKILEILGDNYIKEIIYDMFINAIKKCEELSKHLDKDCLYNLFKIFTLKYYFKDTVCSFKNKKILVVISGRIIKKINFEIVANSGDLFGSSVIDELDG